MNPVLLTVKVFPLLAVAVAAIAFFVPAAFAWGGRFVVPMLSLIMLGMGATLAPSDFLRALKRPKAVGLGMTLQFGLMPLLGFGLGHLLRLPPEQVTGMVLVGSVAGGTASNVISYLAGGDTALSITMTAASTAAGVVMTPLLTQLYLGQTVSVPVWGMFKGILLMVAAPVALGVSLNRLLRGHRNIIATVCPLVSVGGILFVIGVVLALAHDALQTTGARVLLGVILHNGCGLALGYCGARLLRFDPRIAITVAIETGMQNSGLAVALAKQFFTPAAALPGAIFSVWHNLSGAACATLFRRLHPAPAPDDAGRGS